MAIRLNIDLPLIFMSIWLNSCGRWLQTTPAGFDPMPPTTPCTRNEVSLSVFAFLFAEVVEQLDLEGESGWGWEKVRNRMEVTKLIGAKPKESSAPVGTGTPILKYIKLVISGNQSTCLLLLSILSSIFFNHYGISSCIRSFSWLSFVLIDLYLTVHH